MRFLLSILLSLLLAMPAFSQPITTINGLPNASTPLAGDEVVPLWQGGATKKVSTSNILPNIGVTPGSYGDATNCASFTVNEKGLITAASQSTSCPGGGGGGGSPPGGSANQVQFNNAGVFGGISGITSNGSDLTAASGALKLSGATSGTATLNAPSTGGGTLTLPGGTDTLAGLAAVQTLLNKTIDGTVNTILGLNASNLASGTVPAARMPAFSGDATTIAGALAITFNNVNSNIGTFGSTTQCPTFTVNAKGLVTAASQTACNNGDVTGPGSSVSGNLPAFSGTGGKTLVDSGVPAASVAMNGIGQVLTGSNPTLTAAQFNQNFPLYTLNGSGRDIAVPAVSGLQSNGGGFIVVNPSTNTATVTPNAADNINGGATGAAATIPAKSINFVTTGGSNALFLSSATLSACSAFGTTTGTCLQGGGNIGTPSGGVATNLTGLPLTTGVTGVLPVANGGTGQSSGGIAALTAVGAITGTPTGAKFLRDDMSWQTVAGGGGSPGGSPGAVQGNIASAFAAIPNFTFDTTSGALTAAANGAASAPGLTVSGTPQAGTASNSYPQLYVATAGATQPTTFATGGTLVGGNAPNSFAGNLMAFYVNGAASPFFVDSAGEVNAKSYEVSGNSGLSNGLGLQNTNAPAIYSAGSERMRWGSTFAQINYALVDTNNNGWQMATGASSCSGGGNILPRRSDSSIGIGSAATSQGCLAASGEVLRWTSTGVTMQKGYLTTMGYTFSTLPATPPTGAEAFITDASSCTPAATVSAGGGSSFCKLIWNGSAWKAISG